MEGHDIIVIGASAGGVEALSVIASRLPDEMPAAIFVVLHMSPDGPSVLPRILNRAGRLPAIAAHDGDHIHPGRIYVAVPDHHLLVEHGHMRVIRGPKENRTRPAIDPLFRSAARTYGPRVIGVVCTGSLDDGASGLLAIKRRGGLAVVQDPNDALIPSMPLSALRYVQVDYQAPAVDIAPLLTRLASKPAPDERSYPVPEDMNQEANIAAMDPSALEGHQPPGSLAALICPECKGPLWELRDGQLLRYRCRVGHAFTADSLLTGQSEVIEDALWTAFNTLEENAKISQHLAAEARMRNHLASAQRLEQRAREKMRHVEVLRELLTSGGLIPEPDEEITAEETGEADAASGE